MTPSDDMSKEVFKLNTYLELGIINTVEQLNTLRKELWNNIKEYMTLHPHDDWDKAEEYFGICSTT